MINLKIMGSILILINMIMIKIKINDMNSNQFERGVLLQ